MISLLVGESAVVGVVGRSSGGGELCWEYVCSSNRWRRRLRSTESSVGLSLESRWEEVEGGLLVGMEVLLGVGSVGVGVLIVEEASSLFLFLFCVVLFSGVIVLVGLFVW